MYRAFNLTSGSWARAFESAAAEFFIKSGTETQKSHSENANEYLHSLLNDKVVSGQKLKDHWFPQITADVFISHFHKDEEEAIKLAGMLKSVLGLEPFIDSCVWGNSRELLRTIDDKYCLRPDGESYDYNWGGVPSFPSNQDLCRVSPDISPVLLGRGLPGTF